MQQGDPLIETLDLRAGARGQAFHRFDFGTGYSFYLLRLKTGLPSHTPGKRSGASLPTLPRAPPTNSAILQSHIAVWGQMACNLTISLRGIETRHNNGVAQGYEVR